MTEALDTLVELLDLEPIEVNIFRGLSPAGEKRQRVFGGQVAAQALVAAGRTVEDDQRVHSLHAYFLRPGDPSVPILYDVDRIRDGRSFTTRRVVAIQHGRAIFNLSASFQVQEEGFDHQLPMPNTTDPEDLATFAERMKPYAEQMGDWYTRPRPFDQRYLSDPLRVKSRGPRPPHQQVWLRADGKLDDDPLLHACMVAYASDMTLLDSILLPHHRAWDDPAVMMASLDHAMWFHRPIQADEWFLYDQHSPSSSGARGLAMAHIFTRSGDLAVSVVQEGLVRQVDPDRRRP